MYVDERFRVNIYLDTNILIDYSENNYPLLKQSIDYLARSPFVNLRSSHYVLFEYTEVRKANLFRERLSNQKHPFSMKRFFQKIFWGKRDFTKDYIKRNRWKIGSIDYYSFEKQISEQVEKEVADIRNTLNIDFEEHVLHPQLIGPTATLCLKTKLSKEDSLVIVSCILPQENQPLMNCVILSRDKDMFDSFNEKLNDIETIFRQKSLFLPTLTKSNDISGRHNLYKDIKVDVESCWRGFLRDVIIGNNASDYIGRTYVHGNNGEAAKCVYFELANINVQLRPMTSLYFIAQDLTWVKTVKIDSPFWNNGAPITLPHGNPNFPKYSFMPSGIADEDLAKLRRPDSLVFYAND